MDKSVAANDIIKQAVFSTNFIMKAARSCGIKRIVITSCISAVAICNREDCPETFNESDWSEEKEAKKNPYNLAQLHAE